MRLLKTFGRDEYILTDEEAEKLEALLISGKTGFIKLSSGELINISSIEALRGPKLVPRYKGHIVAKDGIHFYEEEKKIVMGSPELIEWIPDPKYKTISKQKLLK